MYAVAYKHSCDDVGKTIKRTKRKYLWEFGFEISDYDVERHQVTLYYSVISGKRQLYVDGEKISSSKGQYGKYQMKFNIDKHQNIGLIQADGDSSTLFINNIEFKQLYSQGNKMNVNDGIQKKIVFKDMSEDSDDLDDDAINHLYLKEERYNNVESKIRGKNHPQLFDRPLAEGIDPKRYCAPPEIQQKNQFQSFGVEAIRDSQFIQNPTGQNNSTQNSNSNKPVSTKDPFSGFNFNSWIQNEQQLQKSGSFKNLKIEEQTNFVRSQSVCIQPPKATVNQQQQQQQQQINQDCPFFGPSSVQSLKQQSFNQKQNQLSNQDKVFDDFFNHNKNAEDNRQTFQINGLNGQESIKEDQMRSISSRANSNQIQGSIQFENNQIAYLNKKGSFYNKQEQVPSFGQSQTNNQLNKFNAPPIQIDLLEKEQISQPNYNLL